jgi:ubiquinone/menaquinone biosynthesis C-methylase UbiE
LAAAAEEAGFDVVAVEPDPEMAALAAARLGRDVVVAGLPDLPFADDGFDVVVANFVLNHVEHPRAGARELAGWPLPVVSCGRRSGGAPGPRRR